MPHFRSSTSDDCSGCLHFKSRSEPSISAPVNETIQSIYTTKDCLAKVTIDWSPSWCMADTNIVCIHRLLYVILVCTKRKFCSKVTPTFCN